MPHHGPSRVPAWVERNFDFTLPVEQYPNVCIRLRGTPARLEELLRNGVANADGPPYTWSAQEHAGHLLDLEPLWMARVEDFLAGRATLSVADPGHRESSAAGHTVRQSAELLAGFRTARLRLVEHLGRLHRDVFARTSLHPRLKQPMRLIDHLHFVVEHDDHHLAKMWEMME